MQLWRHTAIFHCHKVNKSTHQIQVINRHHTMAKQESARAVRHRKFNNNRIKRLQDEKAIKRRVKKEVKAKTAKTVAALKADIDHLLGYSSGGNSNLVTKAELSAFKDEIEGMHHCLKTTMDGLNLGIRQRMTALETAFDGLTMELNNM